MPVVMCVRFILLFFLTSSSQASIPASTIDSDAAEISNLGVAFISSSPAIIRRSQSLVCEMINKCCPVIKPRLVDYVQEAVSSSEALVNACIGNYPRHSLLDICPTLSKFIPVATDKDFLKYAITLNSVSSELQSLGISIPQVCSSDEAYAILCDLTERHKVKSCERKRLAYVAQHVNDNDYQKFVRMTKNNIHLLINATSKAFPTVRAKTNLLVWSSSTMQIKNTASDFAQTAAWIFITLLTLLRSVFFCLN
jgi:hypothetical protein